jgi:hypothetical protein
MPPLSPNEILMLRPELGLVLGVLPGFGAAK